MIVDAAVHPLIPAQDYYARLPGPWRDHYGVVPGQFGRLFDVPFAEGGTDPEVGTNPKRTAEVVFGEKGADAAVLTPLTRGLLPNRHHNAAVCRATNEWVRDVFLDQPQDRPWFASIRVPTTDIHAAVREIELWADDPRFVQIAVPTRALAHYGEEQFFPIWEAAVAADMPVYIQDDIAQGAEPPLSIVGQPIHWAEVDAMRGLLAITHLGSFIGAGTYERLPELRVVFGDGGIDLVNTLMWRMNNDWRAGRVEVPWISELPTTIAERFARFVTQVHDHTTDGETYEPTMAPLAGSKARLIYGSHTPFWDGVKHEDVLPGADGEDRDRVLAGNVLEVTPRLAAALERAGAAA